VEKKKLLIVDDIPENLTILYKTLHDDYDIIGANNGPEALVLAQSAEPDLILLDIMMPGMNGFEVCRILKEQETLREIPVIFVTALDEEAEEVKGFSLGAVDYITKPFKPAILKRRVKTHLDIRQAEKDKWTFEQQLQHTQKLESLGVLSGGIAHDFNNILAIIMGYCSLIKMDYETTENNIAEIEKAVERAAGLCRQMLAYAGHAPLSATQVNMWMLVDEMVNMLKATLPQNAVIKPELSTNIPQLSADANQVRQIVMNLIINASEAIGKEQGVIRVSLTKSTLLAGHSEKDYTGKAVPSGKYLCFEVTDNGCGMDEETKWRIFEPFYTTKFTGRGLGMSAVLGIINSHNGALQLFSQLGRGTTFKVFLPVQIMDTMGDEDQIHTPSVLWQGTGTILLVEDEDQIRNISKILLQKFGFTVLEAVNGKEALDLYQKNVADITLILTDMGMPVMDGYALLSALQQVNNKRPIIISSGFGDADVASRTVRDNIAGIISKPYNPSQLRDVLKNALEGTQLG